MSKYTTEVRYICEASAGLEESVGYSQIESVISQSWQSIFDSNIPFYSEETRARVCKSILRAYYTREICAETVGLWKLWLNNRLYEIMPYYNPLYATADLVFDVFGDVDLTRTTESSGSDSENGTVDVTGSGTSGSTGNTHVTGTDNSSATNTNTRNDLYSDTPQGGLSGIDTMTYLTNAEKISDSGSNSVDRDTSSQTNTSGTGEYSDTSKTVNAKSGERTENRTEKVKGKQGTQSYASMLKEYRETILNIDRDIIRECADLFFGLW